MKLLHRLYQVSSATLTHRFDASAYLLDTEQGLFLIDCGTVEGYGACLDNIRSLGYKPEEVKAIFGTHGHYDHVGAASLFKRDFGTELYLHEADKEQVETADPIRTTAGLLYGTTFPPCTVDRCLADGSLFDFGNMKLTILHTPGHSPGSLSILLETAQLKILIAADTLHGGFSLRIGSDEEAWKASLKRLSSMHFDLMSFGHCSPSLLADVDSRIDCAARSFATYYVPWFKDFFQEYTY